MTSPLITVLTKAPLAGRVKTRLSPALGLEGAAQLHSALVDATLDLLSQTDVPYRVAVGSDPEGQFEQMLRSTGIQTMRQAPGDLGHKMRAVLTGAGRRVAIGTDCVVFDPAWLRRAAQSQDAVAIAPSEDGGYWALSVDGNAPQTLYDALFEDIPWSTAEVLSATLARCARLGISVDLLPTCYDIDLPSDLSRLLHDPRCPSPVRSLLESLPCLL